MSSLGTIWVDLGLRLDKFDAALKTAQARINRTAQTVQAGMQRVAQVDKTMSRMGQSLSLNVTRPLMALGGVMVGLASTAAQTQGKFDTVFGDLAGQANSWADEFASAVGRSRTDVRGWMAELQDTLVPLGFARDKALEMSEGLTGLAVDVASFNNASDPEVISNFAAAIMGNHEAVRSYGIAISETALSQEAMRQGLGEEVEVLSESEKAMLRYAIVVRSAAGAQGDAVRNGDSFANQMKQTWALAKDLGVEIGQVLLPVAQAMIETVQAASKWFGGLSEEKQRLLPIVAGVAAAIGPLLSVLETVAGVVANLARAKALLADSAIGKKLIPVLGRAAKALWSLQVAGGPLLWAIQAIIAVVVALYLAWKNNFFGIQEKTQAVIGVLTGAFQLLRVVVATAWAKIKGTIYSALQGIMEAAAPLARILPATWQDAFEGMRQAVAEKVQDCRDQVDGLADRIDEATDSMGAALGRAGEEFSHWEFRARTAGEGVAHTFDKAETIIDLAAYRTQESLSTAGAAAVTAAVQTKAAWETAADAIDQRLDIMDTRWQIAQSRMEGVATQAEILAAKKEYLTGALEVVAEKVSVLAEAYNVAAATQGAASDTAQELLKRMLDAQAQQAGMEAQVRATTKAIEEQAEAMQALARRAQRKKLTAWESVRGAVDAGVISAEQARKWVASSLEKDELRAIWQNIKGRSPEASKEARQHQIEYFRYWHGIDPTSLAAGGIATRPTAALIAEGGEAEAVIPLSRLDSMLDRGRSGSVTINVELDGEVLARAVIPRMVRAARLKGVPA